MAKIKIKVEFEVEAADECEAALVVESVLANLENEDCSGTIVD